MHSLKMQIEAATAKMINEAMRGESEEAVWEAIKDCSTYEEALRAMLRNLAGTEATVKALGILINNYTKRNQKHKKKAEQQRAFIQEMMNTAGVRKAPLPEGTLSIGQTAPKVIVTDVELLPDDCVKKTPKLTEIKERLKDGEVAGATLSNGGESLRIVGLNLLEDKGDA